LDEVAANCDEQVDAQGSTKEVVDRILKSLRKLEAKGT